MAIWEGMLAYNMGITGRITTIRSEVGPSFRITGQGPMYDLGTFGDYTLM